MSRLVKLLGMLGSDFDGERANAAAMIAKMAKDAKTREALRGAAYIACMAHAAPAKPEGDAQ